MPRWLKTRGPSPEPNRAALYAVPAIPRRGVRRLRARGRLAAENRLYARVIGLPGADEKPELELGFASRPGARIDDPASVRRDPVREATVTRERVHQLPEEPLVAELELQCHLSLIVGDAPVRLPTGTSDPSSTSG